MYVLQRADAEKSPCSWHEVTESVCHSCPGRRDSTKATVRVHNLGVHDGMMTRCGQLGYGRWLRESAAPVVPSPSPACMLRGAGGVPTPAAWQRTGGASIETLSPALQHGTTCGWGERSTLAARAATPLLGRRRCPPPRHTAVPFVAPHWCSPLGLLSCPRSPPAAAACSSPPLAALIARLPAGRRGPLVGLDVGTRHVGVALSDPSCVACGRARFCLPPVASGCCCSGRSPRASRARPFFFCRRLLCVPPCSRASNPVVLVPARGATPLPVFSLLVTCGFLCVCVCCRPAVYNAPWAPAAAPVPDAAGRFPTRPTGGAPPPRTPRRCPPC